MSRLNVAVVITFFCLWLIGCGTNDEALDGFIPLTNDEIGLTVSYPEMWVTDTTGQEMIVASDGDVILEGDYTGAAAVILFVEPIEKVGIDLLTFMETELVGDRTAFVVEKPEKVTINELDAVTVLMAQPQGDLDLFLSTTLIRKDKQVAFVLTVYDSDLEETYTAILDQIVNSVQFTAE
jgi:hypothetical protein